MNSDSHSQKSGSRYQPAPGDSDSPPIRRSRLVIHLQMPVHDVDPPVRSWLPRQMRRLADLAGATAGELTLRVVGDQEMSELHEQFKQVSGTTDVLTFDLRNSPEEPLEGDIVVCLDEAVRQAQLRNHPVRHELLLYSLHGLLHLLGYDDHRPADFRRMHAREDELLSLIGIGSIFVSDTGERSRSSNSSQTRVRPGRPSRPSSESSTRVQVRKSRTRKRD